MEKRIAVLRGDGIGPEVVNESIKVLERVAQNPSIKQQELVSATGKSIATVKRIMKSLQDKNYIHRENGKRYGKQSILFRLLLKIGRVEKWSL